MQKQRSNEFSHLNRQSMVSFATPVGHTRTSHVHVEAGVHINRRTIALSPLRAFSLLLPLSPDFQREFTTTTTPTLDCSVAFCPFLSTLLRIRTPTARRSPLARNPPFVHTHRRRPLRWDPKAVALSVRAGQSAKAAGGVFCC